ncbi:MAG: hypothetical protein AB1Z98_29850 [Nannocystaceae bacterium]
MITAVLALALAPAPVYVEIAPEGESEETRSLRDQLMLRLLEEGYPLAPSPQRATRTLTMQPVAEGIRVEARGQDVHAFEVATGPVLPLEAVHRAMQALDEVTPRAEPSSPAATRFAVHVQDAPASISPEAIRGALMHQVLGRSGVVVPLDAEPDAVLCVETLGDDLAVSRGQTLRDCGRLPTVVTLDDDAVDVRSLDESMQQLMEAPEAVDVRPIATTTAPRVRPSASLAADREPVGSRRMPAIRVGARAGVYGRLESADAAVGSTLRVGREPGPGGLLDILMVPASAPDISIFETSISGGFGWMWAVHPVVALHAQGLLGVQVHRFRQRGNEAGNRVDWTAEIPLGASFQLAQGLRLDLTVRGGRAGRPREHRVDDVVVWERTAWRVGGAVGLSYGWRGR